MFLKIMRNFVIILFNLNKKFRRVFFKNKKRKKNVSCVKINGIVYDIFVFKCFLRLRENFW